MKNRVGTIDLPGSRDMMVLFNQGARTMLITKRSMITGRTHSREIEVTPAQLSEFNQGSRRLIQEIFPDLTAAEREFIKTGITSDEWDEFIKDPDEEEEWADNNANLNPEDEQ